jgi:hypothetical protein
VARRSMLLKHGMSFAGTNEIAPQPSSTMLLSTSLVARTWSKVQVYCHACWRWSYCCWRRSWAQSGLKLQAFYD